VFTTIDALTFLNFDDDSLTNRDLFIELRDNAFFMFFEFMISTFVHEFLSREFVILLFSAIRINVENDSKDVFDFKSTTIFFFFETMIFYSWKSVFDFMNFATTNLKISRIVCDFSAKYNLILMWRVKSIFFFSFILILQFEIYAMYSRFSHASHFLCLSMMLKSQSLVRCFFAHVLYIITVLQCLSIWLYFWQLKHCRKMHFLMNRSHFFISKIFNNSSNNNRFVIFTMTISIWKIEYFFFFSIIFCDQIIFLMIKFECKRALFFCKYVMKFIWLFSLMCSIFISLTRTM
jgi:hypothetical protein